MEPELDIDPAPLTPDTFFKSPGYWRVNASREAMEGRGAIVTKPPLAATEDMIAAREARLGVRLPLSLRRLYCMMNGGYVGWLFVPLKANPQPVYDDWRGAFSIDYSSLVPLEKLRTVAEHYEDFTHEPEEVPAGADRLIILQARYDDMTLLDYTQSSEPRVLIVDYDKPIGDDPVDIAFATFDTFFAALRRRRSSDAIVGGTAREPGPRLGSLPRSDWPSRFWGQSGPHAFHSNAVTLKAAFVPKLAADGALVNETQARLRVTLPAGLVDLWRIRNGGSVSSRYIELTTDDGLEERETMRYPVPLEYLVRLADLSDRIAFPPGDVPWKERHAGADQVIVLEADHNRAVLLDYRDRPDGDPAVLLVDDLDRASLTDALRFGRFDDLLDGLRIPRGG